MCRFPPRKRQHSVDSGRAIRSSQASTFSSLDFVKFLLPDTVVMIKNIFFEWYIFEMYIRGTRRQMLGWCGDAAISDTM